MNFSPHSNIEEGRWRIEDRLQPSSIYNLLSSFSPAIVALILLAGCTKESAPNSDLPAPKISEDQIVFAANAPQLANIVVETAQKRDPTPIHLFGRLAWNEAVTVRVFSPVAGRVLNIPAALNQTVAAGDVLAEVDSPDYSQALADVRTAAGNFSVADKAYSRAKELLTHGAAAQKDVEAAESAFIAARAEKDRAEAKLANYGGAPHGTNAAYLLRSPLAGVVVERNVTPGQEIRGDQMLANAPQFFSPLFVVTDPTRLWVQLDVPETDLRHLKHGLPLKIRAQSLPDETFTGEIETVSEALDPNTHTLTVRGSVANSVRQLKAEMFVSVELPNEDATKLEVPAKAIYLRGNAHCVFVEESPGVFRRREVNIGETSDDHVEVVDGLKPGEHVVTDGALLLEEMFE